MCGGVEDLNVHHQTEYVMMFLMGLSETFTHARGQVLLMDLIPPINKVFALLSQEEKHRTVGGHGSSNFDPTNALVVLAKSYQKTINKYQKRDCPVCTHCKIVGHAVEKGCKRHGYPWL